MWPMLQPYVYQAATLRVPGCNPMCQALLIGLSDGSVIKLPLGDAHPSLPDIDLAALRVADVSDEDNGAAAATARGRVRITSVASHFVMRVDGEAASSSANRPLKFDYSASHQLLALVNSSGKLMIRRAAEDEAEAEETILGAQMPDGACVGCDWEPGLESQLSVAVRGAGAALWRVGSDDGVQAKASSTWSRAVVSNAMVSRPKVSRPTVSRAPHRGDGAPSVPAADVVGHEVQELAQQVQLEPP